MDRLFLTPASERGAFTIQTTMLAAPDTTMIHPYSSSQLVYAYPSFIEPVFNRLEEIINTQPALGEA